MIYPKTESELREERIENMRKYFKNKREEELIEKAWEAVPDWKEFKIVE